jgi:hypothetical protein
VIGAGMEEEVLGNRDEEKRMRVEGLGTGMRGER